MISDTMPNTPIIHTKNSNNTGIATNAYRYVLEKGRVALWFGHTILFDNLDIIIHGQEGEEIRLTPSVQESATSIAFVGEKVTASLDLVCKDTSCLVGCTIELEQHPFQHNCSIKSEKGITIRLTNLGGIRRWHAAYRHKDWWSRPAFGEEVSAIPPRTQSLLWETEDTHWYGIALSDGGYTAEAEGLGEALEISLSSYCAGMSRCQAKAFAFSCAEDPFDAVKTTIAHALRHVGSLLPLEERHRSDLISGFGWCSWDAFYHTVNEEGILAKAREFAEKGIPVNWMLIDDGWLQESDKGLTSFKEDPMKFPSGFKALVKTLKEEYGVRHVGVWHAFCGYWGGIATDSRLAYDQKQNLMTTPSGRLLPSLEPGKAFAFWNGWYEYLSEQGIDFVKVDGQSGVSNQYRHTVSTPKAAGTLHAALEAAASLHFSEGVINCMGMATENLWNRRISTISRNSDDYVPQDDHGFAEHAMQNVYNSLYHGQLYVGDLDMFWSEHPERINHALLRAIGGGPVYISDPVGNSDGKFLEPLLFSDGSIASCDGIPKPAKEVLFHNPLKERVPLKVNNTAKGVPLHAFFNLHKDGTPIEGMIALPQGVARGYFFDVLTKQLHMIQADRPVSIALKAGDASMYQMAVPKMGMAILGLLEKFVPIAGVVWSEVGEHSLLCKVRDKGMFGFVCEQGIKTVTINGKANTHALAPIEGCSVGYCCPCEANDVIWIQTEGQA